MAQTRNATAYDAIIFDLDGTLRISRPRFMDALLAVVRELGMPVDPSVWPEVERWVHYYWARSPELQYDLDTHGEERAWLHFMRRLLEKAGYPASEDDAARLQEAFREQYAPESVLPPGALETLQVLRARVPVLGVLSNRREPFQEELDNLGIADFFDFTLAAGEVGVWKPEPGVFHAALQRAGDIPPDRAVYVGDNYYADVKGARAAGMDVILVDLRGIFADADCPRVTRLSDILTYIR